MYLQRSNKDVLATGYIENIVSAEGSTVIRVLVEALDIKSAEMVRSTLTLAFSVAEMAAIAEAYDCGLDVTDEDDNVETAHG